MDIGNLNYQELRDLQERVAVELKVREQAEKENLRREIMARIEASGFALGEVMPTAAVKPVSKKAAVKYRHPQDPSFAWSGRGRKPQWVVVWLEGGGTLDQLAV